MNERIRKLREHVDALNDAGVRRTQFSELAAQSIRQTEGEPVPIRRARAFAHLLDHTPQVVLPHELIAGSILGLWPPADNLPSYDMRHAEALEIIRAYREWKDKADPTELDHSSRWALMARDHYNANVTYTDFQRLVADLQARFSDAEDLTKAEIARQLERHFTFDYGEDGRLVHELPWAVANHLDLNFPKVVRLGLSGVLDQINTAAASADADKQTFYDSVRIAVEAAIRFVRRYAETLEDESDRVAAEQGDTRQQELREMAAVCRKLAVSAPETFREAIQLVWLVHVISHIGGSSAMSFARFDQYLRPFYEKDLVDGRMTREEAADLVGCLWIKVNEPKMRTVQSMCLAGTRPDGSEGSSDLSRLCMEVCGDIKTPYPNLSVRFCSQSPEWLYDCAVETIKKGTGHPMVLNDERWIPNMARTGGYAIEDARDYYNMGCVEMMVQGKLPTWGSLPAGGGVDFPNILELVFRNGEQNMAGLAGIQTGELDAFGTFDAFLDAYFVQLRHQVVSGPAEAERVAPEHDGYDPFASALIDDCVERGLDMLHGGARYEAIRPIGGHGLGTAADSLAAIRQFVFREKKVSLQELAAALDADFEGYEELQRMLDRGTPRFGNDLDDVDALAAQIFDVYADAVHSLNDGTRRGAFVTSVFSYNRHVYGGETVAATPDGRASGEAFSDSVGPTQGKDIKGPTSLISSVAKLDHTKATGAYSMNLKLGPSLVAGETGSEALKALIKAYFQKGGVQLQVNFVDADVLRDAQDHPEQHRDVIVRVAGYCEYFNNLDRHLQDEIIRRTAHGL